MSQLQQVANRLEKVHIRRARFQGREHFVVPAVMLRPQVLNCNGCDASGEFIPAEEIAASVHGWAGRPVTIGHPTENGVPVSANAPGVLERYQVGTVFNATVDEDTGALKGEAWIDIQLAKRVLRGNSLLERLEAGEMLEVSTGYFRNAEKKKGTHNNKNYGLIQRDILPDHFAILLDETGACSIDHGCGAPRINSEGDSLNRRIRIVEEAFWRRFNHDGGEWYPTEIYEDAAIVQRGTKMLRVPYTIGDDDTVTFGEPEEVKVKYEVTGNADGAGMVQRLARLLARLMGTEDGATNDGGGDRASPIEPGTGQTSGGSEAAINANSGEESNKMDRAKTISALAANSAVPFDAAQLEAMTDEQLAKLQELAGNSGTQQGGEPQKPAANDGGCGCKGAQKPAANAGESHSTGNIPTGAIAEAVRAVIGAELAPVKEFMASHQASVEQQKNELVARLAANERCPFEKEELEGFGLATLEKLERSYMPTSYLGLGGPRGLGSNADDAPPAPPAVLLGPAANSTSDGKEG